MSYIRDNWPAGEAMPQWAAKLDREIDDKYYKRHVGPLAKRDQIMEFTVKTVESVESIVGDTEPGSERDALIAESTAQAQKYLQENLAKLAKDDALDRRREGDEADDDDDDDAGDNEHHASKVADLLVEGGRFADRSSALEYLMHDPHGAALLQRMRTSKQEKPMDTIEKLKASRLAKLEAMGPVEIAKAVVAGYDERNLELTEDEFTALVTKAAQKQHPNLSADRAFAKVYCDLGADGVLLRKAWNIIKNMPIQVSLEPVYVGGKDAQAVNDPSEAILATSRSIRCPILNPFSKVDGLAFLARIVVILSVAFDNRSEVFRHPWEWVSKIRGGYLNDSSVVVDLPLEWPYNVHCYGFYSVAAF